MMTVCEFHWIQPGLLAGSGKPGLFNTMEEDMAFLKEEGIGLIISLTENPMSPAPGDFGIPSIHFPIPDMGFPLPSKARRLCRLIQTSLARKTPVLIHCYAGLGRTGTILACCLIAQGKPADAALREIRLICPKYVQSEGQENFIKHFAMLTENLETVATRS